MFASTTDRVALAVGAAGAFASDRLSRGVPPERRPAVSAAGLVLAAAIYPAARSSWSARAAAARELAALAAYGMFSFAAARRASPAATRLIAAGWASHALFDHAHEPGPGSRIPSYYPALCAGYDVGVAALLLRG